VKAFILILAGAGAKVESEEEKEANGGGGGGSGLNIGWLPDPVANRKAMYSGGIFLRNSS
jgi:hypothetical protein